MHDCYLPRNIAMTIPNVIPLPLATIPRKWIVDYVNKPLPLSNREYSRFSKRNSIEHKYWQNRYSRNLSIKILGQITGAFPLQHELAMDTKLCIECMHVHTACTCKRSMRASGTRSVILTYQSVLSQPPYIKWLQALPVFHLQLPGFQIAPICENRFVPAHTSNNFFSLNKFACGRPLFSLHVLVTFWHTFGTLDPDLSRAKISVYKNKWHNLIVLLHACKTQLLAYRTSMHVCTLSTFSLNGQVTLL